VFICQDGNPVGEIKIEFSRECTNLFEINKYLDKKNCVRRGAGNHHFGGVWIREQFQNFKKKAPQSSSSFDSNATIQLLLEKTSKGSNSFHCKNIVLIIHIISLLHL